MAKRVDWIDTAKGLGIILVIYGHIAFRPEVLNVWLCSFHMPLFFFLSGITFHVDKYKSFKPFLINKIKTLIIPYFIFSAITWIWNFGLELLKYVLHGGNTGLNLKYHIKQAIGIVLQIRGSDYGIGVWFIPCIFIASLMIYCIIKISKKNKIAIAVISTVCLISGYFYCSYIDIKIPWGVDAALVAVFFMAIGYIFQDKIIDFKPKLPLIIGGGVAALVVNIIFAYLNYRVMGRTIGMWSNAYGTLPYFIISAFLGIAFTILVSNLINFKEIKIIGRHSIFYYGIHILFVQLLVQIIGKFISIENDIVAFVLSTAVVLIVLVALRILYPLYSKFYGVIIEKK